MSPYTAAESSKNSAEDIEVVEAGQGELHFFLLESHFLARRIDGADTCQLAAWAGTEDTYV